MRDITVQYEHIVEDQMELVCRYLPDCTLTFVNQTYLDAIKRSLEDLTSSFGRKITLRDYKLTPREIQICNLIKRGLSSKEIARLLNISNFTVGRHRHNIRKKLKITNRKNNFNTFLQEL